MVIFSPDVSRPALGDSLEEQIKQYLAIAGADRYKILCSPPKFEETEKKKYTFVMDNSKGNKEGHVADEFGEALFAELKGLVQRRYDLYLMPLSEKFYFFLVDDLTKAGYLKFFEAGFRPSVLQTTSQGNYQAILKAAVPSADNFHNAANALFLDLNREYGDIKIKAVLHFHRMPGTFNFKPTRRLEDGSAPPIKLIKTADRTCTLTEELWEKKITEIKLEREKYGAETDKPEGGSTEISKVDPAEAFFIHYQDIEKYFSRVGADYSTVDFMVGVRMRVTGHSREAIEFIFEDCARSARPPEAREKHRDWEGYAKKTLASIFGERGTNEVRKYANSGKKDIWLELESRKRRKSNPPL